MTASMKSSGVRNWRPHTQQKLSKRTTCVRFSKRQWSSKSVQMKRKQCEYLHIGHWRTKTATLVATFPDALQTSTIGIFAQILLLFRSEATERRCHHASSRLAMNSHAILPASSIDFALRFAAPTGPIQTHRRIITQAIRPRLILIQAIRPNRAVPRLIPSPSPSRRCQRNACNHIYIHSGRSRRRSRKLHT